MQNSSESGTTRLDKFFDSCVDRVEMVETEQPDTLYIHWMRKGIGFGTMSMSLHEGKLVIDDECMGPDFCKELLGELVDQAFKGRNAEED